MTSTVAVSSAGPAVVVHVGVGGLQGPPGETIGRPLTDFGAGGNGVTDDSAAIDDAFAWADTAPAGERYRLTGMGKTYAVSGNFELPDYCWLDDAEFVQLDPNNTARRTLVKTSGSGPITLRRVVVNRNGLPTQGTVTDAAGIWIANIDDVYMEDVEVYGDGKGVGINLILCDRSHLVRPHVHDIRWGAASDPGSEQVVGLWFHDCTDIRVVDPHIHDLEGEVAWGAGQVIATTYGAQWRTYGANAYTATTAGTTGSTPPTHTSGTVSDGAVSWTYVGPAATNARNYQADGLDFSGCTNASVHGGRIERTWEGTDISGTNPNRNVWFYGTVFRECDFAGWKGAHHIYDSGAIGCRVLRSGALGFVVSGSTAPTADNVKWISCEAQDIGAIGTWPTAFYNITGFAALDLAAAADNVIAAFCRASDRQTVPTMEIGFRNESASSETFRLSGCSSFGHTSVAYSGFTTGNVESTSTGSLDVTGAINATTQVAAQDLRATRFLITPRQAKALVNGLNSDINIQSGFIVFTGPTAAFSVGGFTNAAVVDGTHLHVQNPTNFDMTIVNEDVSSIATNRITTLVAAGAAGNVTLVGQSTAEFIYSGASSRWILVGTNG